MIKTAPGIILPLYVPVLPEITLVHAD